MARGISVIVRLSFLILGLLVSMQSIHGQIEFPVDICECKNLLYDICSNYSPYDGINPFYVRFDGYGNGQMVYAILCKDKKKGNVTLFILSAMDCKKQSIQSEGKASNSGLDDLSWCHAINVYPKKSVNQILSQVDKANKAIGEGILLSSGASEGFLVYWNGTKWMVSSVDVGS